VGSREHIPAAAPWRPAGGDRRRRASRTGKFITAVAERKDVVENLANEAQSIFNALADERRRAKRGSKRAQKRARSVGGHHDSAKRPAPSSPTPPAAQDMLIE
jgi:hypothetical protein